MVRDVEADAGVGSQTSFMELLVLNF